MHILFHIHTTPLHVIQHNFALSDGISAKMSIFAV